jgi:hypothetical protein
MDGTLQVQLPLQAAAVSILLQPEAERGPAKQGIEKEGGDRREQRDEQHTLQDNADHVLHPCWWSPAGSLPI